MDRTTDIGEPASELERLIADLSGSGPLVFVFGDGFCAAHLKGVTTPLFRGPADRRWWHVELGDEAASWHLDVRIDEITGVRFVREPYPFLPSFPGQEVLIVQFLGPGGEAVLHCFVHELYDGQQMRPEKLRAWQALRERYGDRHESRVDRGALLAPAARTIEVAGLLIRRSAPRQARARCVPDRPVTPGNHGHSRTVRYTGSPASRQADPPRKPTCVLLQMRDHPAGHAEAPGHVHQMGKQSGTHVGDVIITSTEGAARAPGTH